MSYTKQEVVDRSQVILAHAWMVRTFVKHSDEGEDFPELMHIARAIFDTSRALETRVDDHDAYLKMLRKKISKLRKATDQFALDAPEASLHTNFQQAVISIKACTKELEELLEHVE
ncbi:MAG: amidohydrolase [Planctomycetes bacterium]|nr:amidohydrolase [Planctomycetota bacterium]MCH9727931.1 amidohydrolase [Planctomycetota bacterium]MCH9778366.1 amidohydrolase [Planctomycetota bacterium]MDF1742885.1 amidohydrolase [Gimesia sp.]